MPATQATPNDAVVVGVDFPRQSDTAIAYAAEEATRRLRPLVLLHAVDSTIVAFPFADWVADAHQSLDVSAAAVRERHPQLEVLTVVVMGPPGRQLVMASATASLVVVGSRGAGGFTGLLLGSVAGHVATHAQCPAVVVPAPTSYERDVSPASGPVLVGIDGSADSVAAVDFAFAQAQARGVILAAASVWGRTNLSGLSRERTRSADVSEWQAQMEQDADRLVSEAIAGHGDSFPDVVVKRMAVHGLSTARVLLDTAEALSAGLVVVGSRGLRAAEGLVLGSVSQQLTHHGDRPIAVVRST